jgi:hypothetical protein
MYSRVPARWGGWERFPLPLINCRVDHGVGFLGMRCQPAVANGRRGCGTGADCADDAAIGRLGYGAARRHRLSRKISFEILDDRDVRIVAAAGVGANYRAAWQPDRGRSLLHILLSVLCANRRALLLNGRVNNPERSFAPDAPEGDSISDAGFQKLVSGDSRYYLTPEGQQMARFVRLVSQNDLHIVASSGRKVLVTYH